MFGRVGAVLAIVAVALSLVGCERNGGRVQFETSLPVSQLGFRVTGGALHIWTGSPCEGTSQVVAGFTTPSGGRATLRLNTPTYAPGLTPGVEFEYLTLGGPYPAGFDVVDPLPAGFDWRTAQRILFEVSGSPIGRGMGGSDFAPIATEVIEHSAEHPEDTYFFPDLGWFGRAEVAAKDGKEFLAVCTPDPGRDQAIVEVVGVRVTDGTLRFWTGAPCVGDTGVIVTFQPGQADLVLDRTELLPEGLEFLSLGGPYPGLSVTHPLPPDFDWRAAKSVLFRLVETSLSNGNSRNVVWSRTTELATPIAESAQHPADTYYFQGQGWLNTAEVAARNGISMHTICGR